MSSTA